MSFGEDRLAQARVDEPPALDLTRPDLDHGEDLTIDRCEMATGVQVLGAQHLKST